MALNDWTDVGEAEWVQTTRNERKTEPAANKKSYSSGMTKLWTRPINGHVHRRYHRRSQHHNQHGSCCVDPRRFFSFHRGDLLDDSWNSLAFVPIHPFALLLLTCDSSADTGVSCSLKEVARIEMICESEQCWPDEMR